MARKKEDRETGGPSGKGQRRALNKSRKSHAENRGDKEDADIIKAQLEALGLTLRQVPGDGNCLFRALGDQMEGHMGNHHRHRQDTCMYMREHREDFQPFVEDDVPFDKHIAALAQTGTYAGNDAIVAFARLHQVTVVIHQPNAPLWQIQGWETEEKANGSSTITNSKQAKSYKNQQSQSWPQLHIAYHGGDHYDSIRRLGDNSHAPANIRMKIETDAKEVSLSKESDANCITPEHFDYSSMAIENDDDIDRLDVDEIEREAMLRSGCTDVSVVRQLLYSNFGNLEAAVEDLLSISVPTSSACTGQESRKIPTTSSESHSRSSSPAGSTCQLAQQAPSGRKKNVGNRKQMEKIRKQERKRASEERKKQPLVAPSQSIPDEETLVIRKVQCLNI